MPSNRGVPVCFRRLREAFFTSGMTQRELQRATGVSHGTMNPVLNGLKAPRADTLERVASVLGTTAGHLTEYEAGLCHACRMRSGKCAAGEDVYKARGEQQKTLRRQLPPYKDAQGARF